MQKSPLLLLTSMLVAAAVGCYTGSNVDVNRPVDPTFETDRDGTEPGQGEGKGGRDGGAGTKATGLPCDVAELLEKSCAGCHAAEPKGGAPNSLLSYEDLTAKVEGDPDKTIAELSLERMGSASRPMPPDGRLPASERAVLETWIKDGMPRGTCEPPTGPGNNGNGNGGGNNGGADGGTSKPDAAVASVCTSGKRTSPSDGPSSLMRPGKSCAGCHSRPGGLKFSVAGTVFPTLHEPDDCRGVESSGDTKVLIIDANGGVHTIPVNAAGNFYRITGIATPYRAMVVRGNQTREMKTPQTSGDCNGCHTERGDGAPGRVMAP